MMVLWQVTGEAAGTAAGLCVERGITNVRDVSINALRGRLVSQGAILGGTR